MRYLPAFFLATVVALSASTLLPAQEPASSFGLTPAKPETLLPEGQGTLPLIPEAMPPLEKAPKSAKRTKEKPSATSAADEALRDRVKLREAKTKVQRDPELQALWDSQFAARSDYEYRQILDRYYTQFWARVAKVDKSLSKELIEALKRNSLGTYDQTRIEPTVPPALARSR